jgi:Ring finger domain
MMTQEEENAIIPESLMALAKDARYLEDVKRLLMQVLGQSWWQWPWRTTTEEEADDSGTINHHREEMVVEMDAWLVSALLYALLVVAKRGKTLGMEATGLAYASATTTSLQQPRRPTLVSWSIATASLIYILRRITLERSSASSATQRMDSLRGNRRRLVFEEQRQAMLQRAQQQQQPHHQQEQALLSSSSSSSSSFPNTIRSPDSPASDRSRLWTRFVRQIVQSITKTLMSSTTCSGGGPHDLSTHDEGGGPSGGGSNFSISMWCLRLYLAYNLVGGGSDNGRYYPTWMHIMAGISLIPQTSSLSDSSDSNSNGPSLQNAAATAAAGLVHRPESMRLVGLLMFVHASGILALQLSNTIMKWWVDRNPPNSNTIISSQQASRVQFDWAESSRDENGDEASKNDTSSSSQTTTTPKRQQQQQQQQQRITTATTTLCAICQERRKFPACPVACGHVFCWNCLQQGLAHRPECPLCRATCRPQDVLPLYDYEPTR